MSRLIESIRVENKKLQNIELHNKRFNEARKALFGLNDFVNIEKWVHIPETISNSLHKCRIISNGQSAEVEITPYKIRDINSLKIVECKHIDYKYKLEDRTLLNTLYKKRENCDDIIIVKNGFISDSWTANILLFRNNKWYTPALPLLKGVQREYLLTKGVIFEKQIHIEELNLYSKIKLINAMVDFERAPEISTESVF